MNIPYVKVFIYGLTFVAYAWSGMGSGVLKNLRDAVITAETVFGDVFRNMITVAEKFKSLNDIFNAAIEEDCIYKCPDGKSASIRNRNHVPKSDGCGSLGLQISSEYLPLGEMTKCCDSHDICYDTCNSGKELCDIEFKRCLYGYCETYKNSLGGETFVKGCKTAAKLLFTGTMTLGCKSYLNAQETACYCPSTRNRHKKYTTGADEL